MTSRTRTRTDVVGHARGSRRCGKGASSDTDAIYRPSGECGSLDVTALLGGALSIQACASYGERAKWRASRVIFVK
jgi:hypothetical protein